MAKPKLTRSYDLLVTSSVRLDYLDIPKWTLLLRNVSYLQTLTISPRRNRITTAQEAVHKYKEHKHTTHNSVVSDVACSGISTVTQITALRLPPAELARHRR